MLTKHKQLLMVQMSPMSWNMFFLMTITVIYYVTLKEDKKFLKSSQKKKKNKLSQW